MIDGYDMGMAGKTGIYVIIEDQVTLVETSASPSVPYILEGLRVLGIRPEEIQHIVLTHIHLDHAGGAGLLLTSCPQAKVVVHPKGAKHLINPERLINGARRVYGEQFDKLFDPILPVPEHKIVVKTDGDTLRIGGNRVLQFMDTPGHAYHHLSIYDPLSKGIFTGDTIGIYYHQLAAEGTPLYLPATSPTQFNPTAMLASLERIQACNVERIYFGHFGMSEDVEEVYNQMRFWLPVYLRTAEQAVAGGGDYTAIRSSLYREIEGYLLNKQIQPDHPVYMHIKADLAVFAMGLYHYLNSSTT